GLAARAIQAVVDPLGRADIEAGDDEADVEAAHCRLNAGDGAPFAIPGLGLVAGLGIAAQNRQFSIARRVRMSSATSSAFLASGLVPDRPKMESIPLFSHHVIASGRA